MAMGPVEVAAVRAAARVLPIVGKKILSNAQRKKVADSALAALVADQTSRFVEHLNPAQLSRLESFVNSAEFGHLMLQTLVCSLGGKRDEADSAIREQLRGNLRHDGVFTGGDLVQATDVLHELLHSAVHAVRGSSPELLIHGNTVAIAAQVATAATRNSELLQRLATLNDVQRFATKLRSQARALYSKLRLPNVVQARAVAHAQLYVTPTLRDARDDSAIPLGTLVLQRLRTVILGDPGAGKSTLATKLVHDLAAGKVDGLDDQVPLLLLVRNHTQNLRTEHDTLLHYLQAGCRQDFGVSPPTDALEYLLLNGRATVIIDGVDELGDSRFRVAFARMVEAFAHLYPLTRIIVTSRVIGYQDAPLDDGHFPVVRVAPFDETQVAGYARRWFALDDSRPKADQEKLWTSFMRESAEAASDLRANPLMLSLLCVLYSAEHFIPRNKPAIYQKCAEVLFETWDRSRGVEVPEQFRPYVRPAVQQLAWRLFTDPQGRQALPKSEMAQFLATSVLAKRFDDEHEAEQAAADFLEFCAGRAWVLTDVGSNQLQPLYGFVHRTFLEFFAAAQLVKQKPDPEAVWNKLRPHVQAGTWEVVSQLAVQILDRDCEDGADAVLRLLLAKVDGHKPLDVDPRLVDAAIMLSFGARCLDSVAPDNATLRRLVHKIAELACGIPAQMRHFVGTDPPAEKRLNRIDSPLMTLLSVQAPENSQRIARALAASVHELASQLPDTTAAGLIYDGLSRGAGSPIPTALSSQLAAELDRLPDPAAVSLWRRLTYDPTPADVDDHGVKLLYGWVYVGRSVNPCCAHTLLTRTVVGSTAKSDRSAAIRALERLYPSVAKAGARALSDISISRSDWDAILPYASTSAIDGLSPTARGTALLLLLPIFRSALQAETAVRDEQLRWFATGPVEPSRRRAAVDLINGWSLPESAHNQLISWATTPLGAPRGNRR